jgi:hypothetical protein
MGDYHLGRACRRRVHELVICEPSIFVVDRPIPKRVISLLQQTTDILRKNIQQTFQTTIRQGMYQYRMIQQHICSDLWSRLYKAIDGSQCWLLIPMSTTILEKMFCGRHLRDIPPCHRDQYTSLRQNRLHVTATANLDHGYNNPHHYRNGNILAELPEKDLY